MTEKQFDLNTEALFYIKGTFCTGTSRFHLLWRRYGIMQCVLFFLFFLPVHLKRIFKLTMASSKRSDLKNLIKMRSTVHRNVSRSYKITEKECKWPSHVRYQKHSSHNVYYVPQTQNFAIVYDHSFSSKIKFSPWNCIKWFFFFKITPSRNFKRKVFRKCQLLLHTYTHVDVHVKVAFWNVHLRKKSNY